jgi:kynurenine formamidase
MNKYNKADILPNNNMIEYKYDTTFDEKHFNFGKILDLLIKNSKENSDIKINDDKINKIIHKDENKILLRNTKNHERLDSTIRQIFTIKLRLL